MNNRFLTIEKKLAEPSFRFVASTGPDTLAAAQSKKAKCTQFSEIEIEQDAFVLDVLQFFFDERLEAEQLNDDLRDIAARALWRATEGSEAMDMVPRPPGGRTSFTWLVQQVVQIGFRRAQNKCIYEAVRRTIKLSMRSEYEIAKNIPMSQTAGTRLATSENGLGMIKQFEGFRAQLYNDPAGHCTIGYGHLVHHGPCDGSESEEYRAGISETRATELLRQRLTPFEQTVNDAVTAGLNQTQFDALTCFVFNVGSDAFHKSTLLRKLNQGQYDQVPVELNKWVHGGGKVLPGLVKRRQAEGTLFKDGLYPATAAAQSLAALGIDLSEFEAPYGRQLQTAPDWCQIRHSIIRSAVEVQGDWLTAGGNLMNESNMAVRDMLVMFWRDGVGMSQAQAEATAAISAADHPKQAFWSAAFVSWCVRNAMSNPPPPHNGGFRFHMRHMAYIAQALRNRENNDQTRPFWLFDINDPNIVPEDGDILCLNRDGTSHSYQSIRQDWFVNHPNDVATGSSHSDIVIGHFEDGGRRWIETIGGNVGDTVGSRYYSLDANGRLVDRVQLNGTPIAGRTNVTQAVGGRSPIVFGLIRLTACANFPS
jgi:GH24 family phage-related lysozyme (muramidase)